MREHFSRRYFLQVMAAGAAGTAGAFACSGSNGGDPEAFGDVSAGNLSALQVGEVKPVSGEPVFIGRDSNGVYAMTTTCTHEGCELSADGAQTSQITCPCHGSVFDLNGNTVRGPAHAPLTHFAVSIAADGTVTVHGGTRVSSSTRTPA